MGRGSSGGGRSSGGHSSSSARSSGGRMSSGGRGGSSMGRGGSSMGRGSAPRGGFSGGGFGGPPPRGNYPPPRAPHPGYGGYGPRRPRGGCMPGCSLSIMAIVLIIMVAVFSVSGITASLASNSSITQSTVSRTKLDSQYTTSTDFYVDELGWIRNSTTLNKGLKDFYSKTGVHPLIYITDTVNGTQSPTSSDMETYASELYDELCPDEGHILLLFHCLDGGVDYNMWYVCGAQAKTVMDDEACDILLDYIDSYFVSDKSDEEMFADAFSDAADRIMSKTVPAIVYVVICAAVVILAFLAYTWWKKYKEQKNLEAQQTADILNADIHTLSDDDPELNDLEDKYK
ncbi:MAG: TPM domain-containing protein [Firmicutes bacterium]|nr:TPM domain-containing protein [Bacillota bacterium]